MSSPSPLWSILICTVPNRREGLARVWDALASQVARVAPQEIEILSFCDNKMRTVGLKRQGLLDIARGEYVSWVDDDDMPAEDYVEEIHRALSTGAKWDVICFNVKVTIDGTQEGIVTMRMKHAPKVKGAPLTEYEAPGIGRPPHMIACWSRELAQKAQFEDVTYFDDFPWAEQLWPLVEREHVIDKTLYHWIGRSNEINTVGA